MSHSSHPPLPSKQDPPGEHVRSGSTLPKRSFHRKTPSLSHFQTTDITKHYAVNHAILQAFESAHSQNLGSVAYAMGLQFVETAVLEIPKHGYFYSSRHEHERMESAVNAVRVTNMLQEMERQDASLNSHGRVEKLKLLAMQQMNEASSETYESTRSKTERELRCCGDDWVVCDETILSSCSESFSALLCPQSSVATMELDTSIDSSTAAVRGRRLEQSEPWIMAPEVPLGRASTAPARTEADTWTLIQPEPVSTLSGSSLHSASFDDVLLEKALYLSGLESVAQSSVIQAPVIEEKSSIIPGPPSHKRSHSVLELETLRRLYQEDFEALQKERRVRISFADTFQGRTPDSTNGCTVIAPLLCMHHLLEDQIPDPGLQDVSINQVIDDETPTILNELRTNLGLSPTAFLIPSDVHDHLIQNGQLSQDQFVTVEGGNILDDRHLQKFVDTLSRSKRKQLAATLFFNEHVVAILKLRRERGKCWYDLIDSLPLKATLMRPDETEEEFARRLGLGGGTGNPIDDDIEMMYSDAIVPMAVRIRCMDTEALKATLRWYACSKFSEENVNYIDQYSWDDLQSDFDPRVFQAFVWSEGICLV